jgi:hypothetical protein
MKNDFGIITEIANQLKKNNPPLEFVVDTGERPRCPRCGVQDAAGTRVVPIKGPNGVMYYVETWHTIIPRVCAWGMASRMPTAEENDIAIAMIKAMADARQQRIDAGVTKRSEGPDFSETVS